MQVALRGGLVTREALWTAFGERCRGNLHIVLAMSPVGEDLRRRCRNFPALVNNCTIDWFDPWPAQALQSVAGAFLQVCHKLKPVSHLLHCQATCEQDMQPDTRLPALCNSCLIASWLHEYHPKAWLWV